MNLKRVMVLTAVLLTMTVAAVAKKDKVNVNKQPPYGWDQLLDSSNGDPAGCNSDRFTCVMGDDAVRDNETGLVWERRPSLERFLLPEAMEHCAGDPIAGRFGWHVPTIEQLASLIDPDQVDPSLPPFHPFIDISITFPPETNYYSSTMAINDLTDIWGVSFDDGLVGTLGLGATPEIGFLVWCVRGGQVLDGNSHYGGL